MALGNYLNNIWGGFSNRSKVSAFEEAGKSSTAIQGGIIVSNEQNRRLQGINKYKTFEDNLANIDIVFASVRLYLALIASSAWSAEAADDSAEAEQLSEKVMEVLDNMESPFVDAVKSAALFKFNGYAWLEMTAKKLEDGTIGLSSIETRPCKTIVRWDTDDKGKVLGVGQQLPLSGSIAYIPRSKSIYLVENILSDSPEGFGYFRSIAQNCLSLQEIQISERMGVNRDLRGIPVGRVPFAALAEAGYSEKEIEAASKGVKDFVTLHKKGEDTSIILDSATYVSNSNTQNGESASFTGNKQYDIEILDAATSGLSDVDKIIKRKNMEIARSLGTEVLLVGDNSGSLALSRDKSANLMIAINGLLKEIADQFNKDLLPFLAKLNGWDEKLLPVLTPSEVSQRSIEETAAVLRDLAGVGIMLDRRDDATKELFRMLDLTPLDESIKEEEVY